MSMLWIHSAAINFNYQFWYPYLDFAFDISAIIQESASAVEPDFPERGCLDKCKIMTTKNTHTHSGDVYVCYKMTSITNL